MIGGNRDCVDMISAHGSAVLDPNPFVSSEVEKPATSAARWFLDFARNERMGGLQAEVILL